MSSFADALSDNFRILWCNAYATADVLYRETGIRDTVDMTDPLHYWNALGVAYRLYCNREPPALPASPFTGGQCVDVLYTVDWYWHAKNFVGNNFNYDSTTGPLRGAIGQVKSVPNPDAPGGYLISLDYGIGSSNPGTLPLQSTGNSQAPFTQISYAVTAVHRVDGQPDSCGDPPPVSPPAPNPTNLNPTFNFNYTDNSNNTVNITGNFLFAPVIIAGNGNVFAPFRLQLSANPQFKIDGLVRLEDGAVQFNFGDTNHIVPRDPGPNDQPNVPRNIPAPPFADGPIEQPVDPNKPPPAQPRYYDGVIVTVTAKGPEQGFLYQQDNPDIAIPRFGYVNFLYQIAGQMAWSEDIPVKNYRQFIPCPRPGLAIKAVGTPEQGVTWTITPVFSSQKRTADFRQTS